MYCKKCGKEIADNSIFCQFCGDKIDSSKSFSINKIINSFKTNMSDRTISFLSYYSVWVVINIICLIFYNKSRSASSYLFPFVEFDLSYYDWSEFILYTILVPYLLYFAIIQYNKYNKKR